MTRRDPKVENSKDKPTKWQLVWRWYKWSWRNKHGGDSRGSAPLSIRPSGPFWPGVGRKCDPLFQLYMQCEPSYFLLFQKTKKQTYQRLVWRGSQWRWQGEHGGWILGERPPSPVGPSEPECYGHSMLRVAPIFKNHPHSLWQHSTGTFPSKRGWKIVIDHFETSQTLHHYWSKEFILSNCLQGSYYILNSEICLCCYYFDLTYGYEGCQKMTVHLSIITALHLMTRHLLNATTMCLYWLVVFWRCFSNSTIFDEQYFN